MKFNDFLYSQGFFDHPPKSLILDLACGTGSETAWLALKYPELDFLGVDLEGNLIELAEERHGRIPNLAFQVGNLFDGDELAKLIDWRLSANTKQREEKVSLRSIWFSQTLSWLSWWREPMATVANLGAEHIGISTLAWDGHLESQVVHRLGDEEDEWVNYNVYSAPKILNFMRAAGYLKAWVNDFEIDVDLEPPKELSLGSYTVKTESGRRLVFSAWQVLPWKHIHFAR